MEGISIYEGEATIFTDEDINDLNYKTGDKILPKTIGESIYWVEHPAYIGHCVHIVTKISKNENIYSS